MYTDVGDTTSINTSVDFSMKSRFGDEKDTVILFESINTIHVLFQFVCQGLRNMNCPLAKAVNAIMWIVKILLTAVCIFTVLIVVCAISYMNRPLSPEVTVEEIQKAVAKNSPILVKYNDSSHEIEASDDLAKLFAFDKWEQTQKQSYDTPIIAFCLAEEWIIDLHSDGKATAYYGYSSSKYKSNAYYVVPTEIIKALSDFVEANGELQERHFEHVFYH